MKLPAVSTLFLSTLAAAGAAQASVSATAIIGQNGYSTPEIKTACAGCITSLSHTDFYDGAFIKPSTTTVTAYAMADYGLLKSASTTQGVGDSAHTIASSETSFADTFRIDAPGLTGKEGLFTAEVIMPFTLTVEHGVYSRQYLYEDIQVDAMDGHSWNKYQLSVGNDGLFGPYTLLHNGSPIPTNSRMILEVPFIYGDPISIQGHLNTGVAANTPLTITSFKAAMDASHSLVWEGISRITDSQGRQVTDYTLTSDSGTNWARNMATPVPEPAQGLLMLAGLAVLGGTKVGGRRHGNARRSA
jgi:hypothetical protein